MLNQTPPPLQQTSGLIHRYQIIKLPVKIGKVYKDIELFVIDTDIQHCLISLPHLNLFDLSLNLRQFTVYQHKNNITFKASDHDAKNICRSTNLTRVSEILHGKENLSHWKQQTNVPSGSTDTLPTTSVEQVESLNVGEEALNTLLCKFQNIFSEDKYDVGCIRLEPQKVVLTSELPISLRPYRASPQDNNEIEKQVKKLVEVGIIRPSHSPYASPVTLVMKKEEGKKTRLCVDYRKLNQITKTDSEPIPRIDTLIDQLTQSKYFSTLDLTSGYWHICINDKDAEKLAFTTNCGLYEWLRLPFGWKNSPSVFQRTIRQILQKYQVKFALNYFDDIIIYSSSWQEHLQHLEQIFKICEKENIKLKLSKCQFGKTKIKFLGYEISKSTYCPSNRNIDVIQKLKPPGNVKELQRFLGTINVYHKFIDNYAKLRLPLNKLLSKDTVWNWTSECQQSFVKLKTALISKPILSLFNPNYPCHLYVDASQEAIGCVLKQEYPDGSQHPIAYHSRQLRTYERHYAITELECLAIVDALDTFHHYLHGSRFTIHTDHAALVWLRNVKRLTGRLYRWSLKLSMFDYEIKYKKGYTNVEADMLSRNPIAHYGNYKTHLLQKDEIITHQNQDNIDNTKFKKINGIWTVSKKGIVKIVIPYSLRNKLLSETHHNFGHPGTKKMIALISLQYYWKEIIKDISNYVKHCEICQLNKKSHQKRFGLLQSLPPTTEPFEFLSIDTIGGLNYYNSTKKYLHVVIDHATRYIWTFPSKSVTTETYTNFLKQIFNIQAPKTVLSDRNAAFTSPRFRKFLRSYKINQRLTTAHHPQGNGKTERVNQSIVTRLKCKINSSPKKIPWTKLLEEVTKEYNDTPHSVTTFPPAYLMYGKKPFESPLTKELFPPVNQAREIAFQKTQENHQRNKVRYDVRFNESPFQEGDLVMLEEFQYPNTRKLSPPFSGPYKILKKLSAVNFEITKPNPYYKSETEVVHVSKLRYFHPAEEFQLKNGL